MNPVSPVVERPVNRRDFLRKTLGAGAAAGAASLGFGTDVAEAALPEIVGVDKYISSIKELLEPYQLLQKPAEVESFKNKLE